MIGLIGIPLAYILAGFTEWTLHKYVLHGPGKRKGDFWSFHFFDHHRAARLHNMVDESYRAPLRGWSPRTKELAGLVGISLPFVALLPFVPWFAGTSLLMAVRYYVIHKRSHLDPDWAREALPWHYDHHMGPDQDCNWGVTVEWPDLLLGTRKVYKGTERERADHARRSAKNAQAA